MGNTPSLVERVALEIRRLRSDEAGGCFSPFEEDSPDNCMGKNPKCHCVVVTNEAAIAAIGTIMETHAIVPKEPTVNQQECNTPSLVERVAIDLCNKFEWTDSASPLDFWRPVAEAAIREILETPAIVPKELAVRIGLELQEKP